MINNIRKAVENIRKDPGILIRSEAGFGAAVIFVVLILNFLLISRRIFSGEFIFGGDTYLYWSFKYVMLYSIKHFGELPWWDPTNFGGYPLYYHFLSGWSNYLSPYYLPSLILFKLLNVFRDISINGYIIFHQTVYIVFLNMAAIYLISRELVKNRIAAVLPVLIFGFSYFQLLNFHDFYAVEAMVAPLFYVYGLIRFNNRRSIGSLILFLVLFGMLCASLQNGILMSAVFWGTIFTVLMLVFNPGMVKDGWRLTKEYIRPVRGKIVMGLLVVMIISGFTAAWLPFHYNAGHILKYRGGADGKQPYNYSIQGGIVEDYRTHIATTESWTIAANWLPLPQIHDYLLGFAWSNHDNRYIGMATLPLLLTALIFGIRNRYVFVLFLTYFICNVFLIYAVDNIIYRILTDNSEIFRNITNMATIFPRGGPPIFLVFLSAIGMDKLLSHASDSMVHKMGGADLKSLTEKSLNFMVVLGGVLFASGFIIRYLYEIPWLFDSLFHIGGYLLVFSFACRMLIGSAKEPLKRIALFCIFFFTLTDLSSSSSSHISNRLRVPLEDYAQHILFPYSELMERGMGISDDAVFGPVSSETERMFPADYQGVYHNAWWPNWSTKEWLALATRETGQRFLLNWKPEIMPNGSKSGRMIRYPDFRLYSNGFYIPFEKIMELDNDPSILTAEPLFYLHDPDIVKLKGTATPHPVSGRYELREYTFNKFVVNTGTDEDSIFYFLDNDDPFWNAYVDGKRVPIHRANFTFKAIELPAGDHTVSWIYNPYPVKAAYYGFYAVLSALLVFLIMAGRSRDSV